MIKGRWHLAIVLSQEQAAEQYNAAREAMERASEWRDDPIFHGCGIECARLWQDLAADTSKRARFMAGIE